MTLLWMSSNPEPGKEQKKWPKTLPFVDPDGNAVTVNTIGDCRRTLVSMARTASEALGVDIDLPEVKDASSAASAYMAPSSRIRTLHDDSSTEQGMSTMEHMMAQMMLIGKGKGKGNNYLEAVPRTFSGR